MNLKLFRLLKIYIIINFKIHKINQNSRKLTLNTIIPVNNKNNKNYGYVNIDRSRMGSMDLN